MNYYIDCMPTETFINKLFEITDIKDTYILNVYVKELPSNNINFLLYSDIEKCTKLFYQIKAKGYEINLMFDTACFGNREFSEKGKETLNIIDEYVNLKPDYITVTNNFFYNYIKNRYEKIKIILSEYLEVNNIQKINRYLELGCYGLKIDNRLIKDNEIVKCIAENFEKNYMHINLNKIILKNSIYSDSINNSIAHYMQNEEFDNINNILKENYDKEKEIQKLEKEEICALIEIGFSNFWYYCPYKDEDKYIYNLKEVINQNYDEIKQYPSTLLNQDI